MVFDFFFLTPFVYVQADKATSRMRTVKRNLEESVCYIFMSIIYVHVAIVVDVGSMNGNDVCTCVHTIMYVPTYLMYDLCYTIYNEKYFQMIIFLI